MKNNHQGFTLIETLMYVALLSFFLSSLLGITYESLGSAQKISGQILLQQEALFLIRKTDWALTGARNVTLITAAQIHIERYAAPTSVDIKYNNAAKTVEVSTDQTTFYTLNSSNFQVNSAGFTLTAHGTARYAEVSLLLNGQPFALKKYLR